MSKKIISMLTVLMLCVSLLPNGIFQVIAKAEESTEAVLESTFEDGTNEWQARGDGVTIEQSSEQSKEGTGSLKVLGRTDTWHGAQYDLLSKVEPSKKYSMSTWVYQSSGETQHMKLSIQKTVDGTQGWDTIIEIDVPNKVWTELKGNYSYTVEATELLLYTEASDKTLEYYMDNVVVTEITSESTGEATISNFEPINSTFEVDNNNWIPRIGEEVLTRTDEVEAHSGSYSLKVSNRANTYDAAAYDLTNLVANGNTYMVEAWVYQNSGNEEIINLSKQIGITSPSYDTFGTAKVPDKTWTKISGQFALDFIGELESLTIYFETPYSDAGSTLTYYLDDVSITEEEKSNQSIQEDIPSLKDVYKDYFSIGAAIPTGAITSTIKSELTTKHFNSITAENAMKPESMLKEDGTIDFTTADEYVKFAKANNIALRGHTLVWHSQTPDWFFREGYSTTGEYLTRDAMLERMENYIKTMIEHFGTDVYAWDVVNEAVEASQLDGMRRSNWYDIIGADFVAKAFEYARKYADPSVKLYYNDYDTENVSKRQAMVNLVEPIKEAGNIDGVGLQAHVNIDSPSPAAVDKTIKTFGDLGLNVQITELDMDVYSSVASSFDAPPEELLIKQGYKFKDLFEVFKANKDIITNVTFWGLTDDTSWLNGFPVARNNWPLLFDKNYQAKYAYWGIVDDSKLPIYTQTIKSYKSTPIIDAESDFVWEVQLPQEIKNDESETITTFKTCWDDGKLYVYANVIDDKYDANSSIELFIDQNNSKSDELEADDRHYKITRNDVVSGDTSYGDVETSIKDNDNGYTMEISIPLDKTDLIKENLGFDILVNMSDGSKSRWNDITKGTVEKPANYGTLVLQDLIKEADVLYGTPNVDADVDSVWENAEWVNIDTYTQNTKGATGKAKMIWDENFIYVLVDVADENLSAVNVNAWEQDSVEIFVDENHGQTSSYEQDDVQYRVSYLGDVSISGGPSDTKFKAVSKEISGGYRVEMAIPFNIAKGTPDQMLGFDFQINDDQGTGKRDSMANWNDLSGNGWRTTENYGLIKLLSTKVETVDEGETVVDEGETTVDEGEAIDNSDSKVLPETGSVVDFWNLLAIAMMMLMAGFALVLKSKKVKKLKK
ncbi:MAG: endo-1,4-beta-xylanase [Clostridiaceae bacterium]